MLRTRWAAIGAAVAVTLGAGGIGLVSATEPSGAVTFVPIEPCRLFDTRPAFQVGPRSAPLGPDETFTVVAHGDNGECTGIPATATGLGMNVTAVGPSQATVLTIWGSGARPNASSLNPTPGQPPTPNAVTSGLTGAGELNVWNAFGSVHVLVDIVGYYTDHQHDGGDIIDGSLTGADLQDGSVGSADLQDGSVGSADVADESLTGADVQDGSIGSADVADNSLTGDDIAPLSNADLSNEAGVAFSNKTTTTTGIGATDVIVHTVAIRPPSDGFVTVHATADWFGGNPSAFIRCQITDGTNSLDLTQSVVRDSDPDGSNIAHAIAVVRTFSVTAWTGTFFTGRPFNLVCDSINGPISMGDVDMTATFVPTSYAPFSIVLPLGDAGRLAAGSPTD